MEKLRISLSAARANANLTQKEVAEKLKISKSTVCLWESGEAEPRISQALALSELYGIPIDNIFFPVKLALSE